MYPQVLLVLSHVLLFKHLRCDCGHMNKNRRPSQTGSPSECSGPQSEKPGLFSAGEPASFFTGVAGVVAGTDSFITRRWNGRGGGRRWGPGVQSFSGAVSFGEVSGPVHPWIPLLVLVVRRLVWAMRSSCFLVRRQSLAVRSSFSLLRRKSGGALEFPAAENDLGGAQVCGAVAVSSGPICRAGSFGNCGGDGRHLSRGARAAQRLRSGGGQRQGRRATCGSAAGMASKRTGAR